MSLIRREEEPSIMLKLRKSVIFIMFSIQLVYADGNPTAFPTVVPFVGKKRYQLMNGTVQF